MTPDLDACPGPPVSTAEQVRAAYREGVRVTLFALTVSAALASVARP